jgi:hypothetical protein
MGSMKDNLRLGHLGRRRAQRRPRHRGAGSHRMVSETLRASLPRGLAMVLMVADFGGLDRRIRRSDRQGPVVGGRLISGFAPKRKLAGMCGLQVRVVCRMQI